MAEVFFTSDTHFGHQKILELSRRPFRDVAEMNAALIENWNGVVGDADIVYHLGDFGDTTIIPKLSGTIRLLPGNYETPADIANLSQRCEILKPNTVLHLSGIRFQLVHEPDTAFPSDVFFLFGHIHKLQMVKRNGLNVGVDCHNFTPISLDDVRFYREAVLNVFDENVFMQTLGEAK
jgi:calcineurin-like phosphoesterase family protein